ncbi:efflux RND transporter periplasmic adaptor subunit [Undibacterium sp. FT79W]|uniref:efflux RND transporter periplasmic adaptor subunit n=1 Tax=Undibacterium sp. FT79W TaxID=2762296 RepID=UPI00164AB4C2|nr:efflux RND transporter periplasmic adaptor subunit [Undibacterium sp. FT79W]MBC3879698.1 efflux RND transporter periplasmic adaptor subunit [Undibacterium sp. FT79W]
MKTNLNKKQAIAIAAIVVVTVLLGALIVGSKQIAVDDDDAPAAAKTTKESVAPANSDKPKGPGQQADNKSPQKSPADDNKIELTEVQIRAAAISILKAGPVHIKNVLTLPGEIHFNEDKTGHVVPRFAGVVQSVPASLGQQVKKGQVLAVIASVGLSDLRSELLTAQKRLALAATTYEREKKLWEEKISAEQDYLQAQQAMREAQISVHNIQQKLNALGVTQDNTGSLNLYAVRAPFDGMLIEKHITLGDAVKEDANIFTISDLSTVWADSTVPANSLNQIRVGQSVTVKASAFDGKASGTVSYVSALVGDQTRAAKARVTLANPNMAWRPGLYVSIEVTASETGVPVAVSAEAVQDINGKPTVFLRTPQGFIAQPVTLGRTDGRLTEIVSGLKAGSAYAGNGSFVLKADLGKNTAKDND